MGETADKKCLKIDGNEKCVEKGKIQHFPLQAEC